MAAGYELSDLEKETFFGFSESVRAEEPSLGGDEGDVVTGGNLTTGTDESVGEGRIDTSLTWLHRLLGYSWYQGQLLPLASSPRGL